MAFVKPRQILLRGTRAAQPTAATVAEGSLYAVTDEGLVEQSDGVATWTLWVDGGGSGVGSVGPMGLAGWDAEDAEIPISIPGAAGSQGVPGTVGATGPMGLPGWDAEDVEIPLGIAGPAGPAGPAGSSAPGATGPMGLQGWDAEEPEIPIGIPGAQGPQGAAGAGGGSATTVEVNLAATATWRGRFTITDAAITAASKVLVWQAPGPYTGKGTRADEAEMQPVSVIAAIPAVGTASVSWQTPPIVTWTPLPQMMFLTAGTTVLGSPKDPQSAARGYARRLGKVRGNVQFTYMVL